jgi:RNA polymerase sigma-70 factor (ECF subfamily)
LRNDLESLLPKTLARDPDAARAFVARVLPLIHSRVARLLARDARARRARSEVEDLTQDVLVALLDNDARALRAWDPARGRSLSSFIVLLTDHAAWSILRDPKRTPWREEPSDDETIEAAAPEAGEPEAAAASREMLFAVSQRLRAEVSPRGIELFTMLVVEGRSIEEVCAAFAMTRDAVYAWRYRFSKLSARILGELTSAKVASDRSPALPMET